MKKIRYLFIMLTVLIIGAPALAQDRTGTVLPIPPAPFKGKVGETYKDSIRFNLSLHGLSKEMAADVRVVKLAKNRILAVSVNPIIVNADQYNLLEGVEKLREVANLPSISTAVPVTFSLIFKQQ